MKIIASHYQGDWKWIPEYTSDFFIYNRTEEEIPNSVKVPNIGNADYDRLTYLIDNYYNLPEVFVLTKSNLFKYITKEEFDLVKDNKVFTPLLTQGHKTYEPVCRYVDGMYEEINNSWYVPQFNSQFDSYNEWAAYLGLPTPEYLQFAPGGNYILTPKEVYKHPEAFYMKMRDTLTHAILPAEAQMVERTYYTLWK
jgi:hypothetical protein